MPRAQLINANTGEILEDLGWFETANQARSACDRHAERLLVWERSPDDLWVAEGEDEVYQVESGPTRRQREPKIVAPSNIVQAELGDDSALGAATIALFNSITPTTDVLSKLRSG